MYSLVDFVEAVKVGRSFVGESAALSLPRHCCKIVRLVIDGPFTDIIPLECSLEVENTSSQF